MKGYTSTINIETLEGYYSFDVEVTDYYAQKPMGKWADSDVDCYGYTDLEYNVLGGSKYNEDTDAMEEISLQEAVDKADELSDIIWDKLNSELVEEMEDDYYE